MKITTRTFQIALCLLLSQNAICAAGKLFNVSATGTPATAKISVCLNAKGPLSCQVFTVNASTVSISSTIPNHLYSNAGIKSLTPGYTVQGCTEISNGYCTFSTSNQTTTTLTLSNGTQNTRFAYVPSAPTNNVLLCNVNATTGALSGCAPTGPSFSSPMSIAINLSDSRAYVANTAVGEAISLCDVDSTTGMLSNCVFTGTNPGTITYSAITLNAANTYAFLADNNNYAIFRCAVNGSTGALSGCATVAGTLFVDPSSITLNAAGTIAYVGSLSANVTFCNVNPVTGAFTGCLATASGIATPSSVALNPAGTFAYVTDLYASLVYKCNVNVSGSLDACSATGSGFALPYSVAVNSAGTYAYVTNISTNEVIQCAINASTGALSNCATTASITQPRGITLK